MPQFFIEAPQGIQAEAKQKMMEDITTAIDDAYHIPDVRVWLREYPADRGQRGRRQRAAQCRAAGATSGSSGRARRGSFTGYARAATHRDHA